MKCQHGLDASLGDRCHACEWDRATEYDEAADELDDDEKE